ncbi:MAG: T9SS type A sorting domain-containing protein [Microscillaceae bacterium]|nr:T9SS type A sorting domain-containing protein [Microscillaceae bacterium]
MPGNAFTCDLSILPVTLTFFEAYAQANQTVRLVWETILEVDNAYYVLARAGQDLHFETIAQIEGAGQSQIPLLYQWIDTEPFSGINYYRLQAIDIYGEVSDTFITSVVMETDSPYHLYPNPTPDWLYMKWQLGASPVSVSIHNISGQEWILSPRQQLEPNKTYAWNLKFLPPGLYILQIKTEQRRYVEKIILQP